MGSGALSMAMLQAGASVTGYEIRADFAAVALKNVHSFLGPDVDYRIEERDVYDGIDRDGPRPGRPRPARAVAGGQARRGGPPPGRDLRVLPAHHRPGGPAPRGAGGERLRPGPDHRGAPAVVARGRPVGAPRPPDGGPHRVPHVGPPAGARQLPATSEPARPPPDSWPPPSRRPTVPEDSPDPTARRPDSPRSRDSPPALDS